MEVLVLVIGLTWLVIGAALSVLMGRRGFDPYAWFVLGVILGPLALVIAVYSLSAGHEEEPEMLAPPPRLGGKVDVVVGFDGSWESCAAYRAVVDLFGTRLGRLTMARVIPHQAGWEAVQEARRSLESEAGTFPSRAVGLEVLYGKPDVALTEFARAGGYDVIAAGTRGAGLSKGVLGSVATELARHGSIPVLLVGGDRTEPAVPELVESKEA
jgi:nucleotide-binding universal stress UspA family protein